MQDLPERVLRQIEGTHKNWQKISTPAHCTNLNLALHYFQDTVTLEILYNVDVLLTWCNSLKTNHRSHFL